MKLAYWIPIRTIAGTKKDKWLECNICGHRINMSDIEELRFIHRNNPDVYKDAIFSEYEKCSGCKSEINTYITHELRARKVAKGDSCLNEIVKNLLKEYDEVNLSETLKELLSNCSCELRQQR